MVARSPAQQAAAGPVRPACGRPLLYPVPAAELPAPLRARVTPGARFAGAIFPLDLPPVRRGERYAAARLAVDLRHPDPVRALAVHADTGEFGLPPDGDATTPIGWRARRAVAGRLRSAEWGAAVDGAGTSRFGWHFADRRAAPDLPRELAGHALLEIPAGVSTLLGFLSAEADLTGTGRRHLGPPRPQGFSVPVPGAAAPAPGTALWLAAAPAGPDVDGGVAAEVLAGLGAHRTLPAPGGARYAALPPDTDLPELLTTLAAAGTHPRLRFALHRTLEGGAPAADGLGALLEAAAVRAALAEHRDAAFALVVPDALFRDALVDGDGPPDPAAFRRITADGGAHAWLYLRRPGLPG
ncbi:hypothetical protein [Catenuloplanes atrovinosus]|uniref:Uncharacterized protein n=1 Tax=Catenuloplanes atrovinosus TaxID=137266 RepID=A0AAE3YM67_9ACTN|nr:hypothetical protein [Catenuloplanes atrovinosus]MDR7274749.1 hypothetical protein [Catenuloplanes atrovinosus]